MISESFLLSDIANIQGGFAFKRSDFGSEGVAIVKIANIQPPIVSLIAADRVLKEKVTSLERFKLFDGDILMAMTGATVGKVGRFKGAEEAYLNQRVARITAKNGRKFDDFIYAVVTQPGFDKLIEGASSGSAQANISAAGIGSVKIPFILEVEQLAIGRIARVIDERITLLNETNLTLMAIATAIFKSWFIDFDPVLAKVEGRLPENIDEDVAALFPDAFDESELGPVPKGWNVETIGELLNRPRVTKRYTKNQVMEAGEYPVYEQGASILLGFHNETPSCMASPEKPLFIFGDHTCITKLSCEPFDISQNVILLEGSKRNSLWTYFAIQGKQKFEEYRRHWMELVVKKAVVPSSEVCDLFSAVVTPLQLKIEANDKNIYSLTNLRNILLPRLISGQLRIAEAEEELEKAIA